MRKAPLLLVAGLALVATACDKTIPAGSPLASGDGCEKLIADHPEVRPENARANATEGTRPNGRYPRADGAFSGGTTEETIEWAACKWGIDKDWAKAQIWTESNWNQNILGDFTTDPKACVPGKPIGTYPPQYNGDRKHVGECPESIGLGQVRFLYHSEAFADRNAINSSAYNLDYTYAVWRDCFEGKMGWLNTVDGRGDYKAGDMKGCMGVWFSGRWYTSAAEQYIAAVTANHKNKPWLQLSPVTGSETAARTPTTTAAPTTTAPKPTVAPTTTAPKPTVPPTTAAPTTTAPRVTSTSSGPGFVETFDGNSGLDRFDTGVYHRDETLVAQRQWTGDHDLSCGGPATQRTIHRDKPAESFYMCKDHLMTSMGDTAGYSTAYFSPKKVFRDENVVSFEVNSTDLGSRQWWEVSLVPTSFRSGVAQCPQCSAMPWLTASGLPGYPSNSFVLGSGPFGQDAPKVNGNDITWQPICGSFALDAEGCASKAIRRTWTLTDNGNGKVTVEFMNNRWTVPGSFPSGDWKLVFKDHNYTPLKSKSSEGRPVIGMTWHWDNIVVR